MGGTGGSGTALWTSKEFHDEAAEWVRAVCSRHRIDLTGGHQQPHCRPWSTAFRFDTTGRPVWLKVNGPGSSHEPRLVVVLAGLVPDLVAEVLATDSTRGWSLTRDAGPMMRSTAKPHQLWPQWEGVVRRYADAQIQLAAHVPELLATGVHEVSPRTLPGQAARLLGELSDLNPDEGGLTALEAESISATLPEYDAWCATLVRSGIPSSIQHDDLHSNNIGWGGTVASARIIDWGDASVGHPLGTMLCTLNSISHHARLELDDPRLLRVRDAYLEPFTSYAVRSDLVRYVELARRVGCVTRALSYQEALRGEPLATHVLEDFPVRGWFLGMLQD